MIQPAPNRRVSQWLAIVLGTVACLLLIATIGLYTTNNSLRDQLAERGPRRSAGAQNPNDHRPAMIAEMIAFSAEAGDPFYSDGFENYKTLVTDKTVGNIVYRVPHLKDATKQVPGNCVLRFSRVMGEATATAVPSVRWLWTPRDNDNLATPGTTAADTKPFGQLVDPGPKAIWNALLKRYGANANPQCNPD